MHAKHRNGPGNGYRSNVMGMGGGMAAGSRIPPEGPMRGYNRMYNSEYRNYNRGGYGSGGHSKQYQPPLPPPRETDVFMEAGKMAAEYLVSKGMLPPNALSGKWQGHGLKNQVGIQGVRSIEAEKVQSPMDTRVSAHSRLGNSALDVGPARRKYSDEYNSVGSRSSVRGRKRSASFKDYGSEVTRELGRSGSLTEKRTFHSAESESDASVGHHSAQPSSKDELHSSSPGETARDIESETQTVSGLEKQNLVEDAGGDDGTSSNEKCLTSGANGEAVKKSDDEAELVKEQSSDNDLQQKNDEKREDASSGMEDTGVSEDFVDLVKHCKFVNVPTRARSSLTMKGLKGDRNPIKDESSSKSEPLEDSRVHIIDIDMENPAGNAATHQNHEFKSLQDDPTSEKERNIAYSTRSRLAQSLRSDSFPERSVYKEQQSDEELSGFGRSKSMVMDRGEKRAIDSNPDGKDDFKKLRQWVPNHDAQSNSSPPITSSMDNKPLSSQEPSSQGDHLSPSPDQSSLDVSLFPKDHVESSEFMQEKQLFPSSFKTCDLNLVGGCDVNENHDAGPMLLFPSITQTGEATRPIDVDLSMSNKGNMASKISRHTANDKDIEVIDLEKDSAHENRRSVSFYDMHLYV